MSETVPPVLLDVEKLAENLLHFRDSIRFGLYSDRFVRRISMEIDPCCTRMVFDRSALGRFAGLLGLRKAPKLDVLAQFPENALDTFLEMDVVDKGS